MAQRFVAWRTCSRQLKPSATISVFGDALANRRQQDLFADLHRDVVVVGLIAERAGLPQQPTLGICTSSPSSCSSLCSASDAQHRARGGNDVHERPAV